MFFISTFYIDEIFRGVHVPSADAWNGQTAVVPQSNAGIYAVAKENADQYFYLKFDEMDLIDRGERALHSVIA